MPHTPMFLTIQDLHGLTRRKMKGGIIRFLQERRIPHMIADDGYPIVMRQTVEKILGGDALGVKNKPINLAALEQWEAAREKQKLDGAKQREARARQKAEAAEARALAKQERDAKRAGEQQSRKAKSQRGAGVTTGEVDTRN